MKKLLLIFGFCCISELAYAGACTPIRCDEASYDVSEMLTQSGITGGPNNNDDGRFSGQLCYMCDTGGSNSQCDYGDTVVIAQPGGQGTAFQCVDDAGPDDSWQQIPESALCTCGDSPLTQMDGYIENAMLSEIHAGECNRGSISNVIDQTGPQLSVCRYRKCNEGYVPSLDKTKCVERGASDTTPEPDPTTTPAPTITCVDRCRGMTGQQYAECTTCCKVPESYADWNGSECICADKTLDFNVLTQQCEAPKVTVEPQPVAEDPVECPTVQITLLNQWLVQYAGNVEITNRIMVILNYCNSGAVDLTVFNSMFLELQNFIKDQSTLSELSSQQAASRRRIANAVSDIRSVVDNLDVSKWRTAEGNFNTSRLLSDSIAGVVLGTAGGLITSNVMKKNQASNGLEDIQCTVGGQVVAGWGDQFQVGIH